MGISPQLLNQNVGAGTIFLVEQVFNSREISRLGKRNLNNYMYRVY